MSADNQNSESESRTAVLLVGLSVFGVVLGYALSIAAARILGPNAFEDYAVAVATLGMLSAAAEAGVGKFALKVIPEYTASRKWGLASGYWRFSLRVTLLVSVLLSVILMILEGGSDSDIRDDPLSVAGVFLPVVAMAGVGVDFVMANRAATTGATIARVIVPGTSLMLLISVGLWRDNIGAAGATAIFGIGSTVGLILCANVFRRTSPRQFFTEPPEYNCLVWGRECAYFAAIGFLTSWIFRIGLIIVEVLPIAEIQVAYFAAALESGGLILLLSKSTDKLFQPEMSAIIQQKAWGAGARLRRRRYLMVGGCCAAFMATMIIFGRAVLRLYGDEFQNGYPALCFVAFGCCMWTLFSLAPAFLRFVGHSRFVFVVTICSAVVMAGLTTVLGGRRGATGAGLAFCIVLSVTSVVFGIFAKRKLSQMKQPGGRPTSSQQTLEGPDLP